MLASAEEYVDYLSVGQNEASAPSVFVDAAKTIVTKDFAKKYIKIASLIRYVAFDINCLNILKGTPQKERKAIERNLAK